MKHIVRKQNMLRKLVTIAVLTAVPALFTTEAMAACVVKKNWTLTQSNGFKVKLKNLKQNGTEFSGFASSGDTGGDVQGKLKASGRLRFTIAWGAGSGSVGEYTAFVDEEDGQVSGGQTFDQKSPGNTASWTTGSTFPCT
jgi:hypothetical protein